MSGRPSPTTPYHEGTLPPRAPWGRRESLRVRGVFVLQPDWFRHHRVDICTGENWEETLDSTRWTAGEVVPFYEVRKPSHAGLFRSRSKTSNRKCPLHRVPSDHRSTPFGLGVYEPAYRGTRLLWGFPVPTLSVPTVPQETNHLRNGAEVTGGPRY